MTDAVDLPILQHGAKPSGRRAEADGPVDLEARLRPAMEELDREREVRKGEFVFRLSVMVLTACALAVISALAASGAMGAALWDQDPGLYFAPPGLAALVLGYWAMKPRQRYISAYKSRVLPVVAGAIGQFHYDESGKIEAGRLEASTLLPSYDSYKSEDKFTGGYKGVDVEMAEAKMTRTQGSGKNRRTVTVFKGLFALLSTHKNFVGKTVVKRDAGAIGNWFAGKFGSLERVTLEDPEFEKRFECYATDQIEARYLLTPAFMERLTALATDIGDGRLQAAFYDRKLFIMVPMSKDLFEPPSIFTSVLKDTGVSRLASELGDMLSIIDVLKLDERTGL